MRYLRKAAIICIRPSMIALIYQFIKRSEKALVCDLLVAMGIAYSCITCLLAICYWYIEKRLGKRK